MVVTPQPGLPNLPVAIRRLIADSTLSTPLVCCSMPGVEQHPGGRRAPPLGRLFHAPGRDAGALHAHWDVISATASAAWSKSTVWASMKA